MHSKISKAMAAEILFVEDNKAISGGAFFEGF